VVAIAPVELVVHIIPALQPIINIKHTITRIINITITAMLVLAVVTPHTQVVVAQVVDIIPVQHVVDTINMGIIALMDTMDIYTKSKNDRQYA
jgi:hypothetical protein